MIRSVYEYNHREWLGKFPQYKFAGLAIEHMEPEELKAALAFMVQYAGDCRNRIAVLEDAA